MQPRALGGRNEPGVLRAKHDAGLDGLGGGGKVGRWVIAKMRSWASLLKALGSHINVFF